MPEAERQKIIDGYRRGLSLARRIDFIFAVRYGPADPIKRELQWRATMVATLEDTTQGNIELGNEAITKAFENYPPKKHAP